MSRFASALCAALYLLGIGVFSTADAAPLYTFTDLGTLGDPNSDARAINNAGQVAGFSYTTLDNSRATLWDGGTVTPLGTWRGGSSQAFAINNAGHVAGGANIATAPNNDWRATVWNGASALGTPSANEGLAYAINYAGLVAGANGLWAGATLTKLHTFSGQGVGTAINNVGQVAGFAGLQAMLWNDTTTIELIGLGGLGSRATAINDAGLVAGYSWTIGNVATRAVLWNGGTVTELGTLGGSSSVANGINNAGQVVGYASTTSGAQHATLWNGTTATDLNSFLDADAISAGWQLAVAYDINDNGWIVGDARNVFTSQIHAFLLSTPGPIAAVPETGTLALLSVGFAGLGFSRRKGAS